MVGVSHRDDRRAGQDLEQQDLEQLDSLFVALCATQRKLLASVRRWDLSEHWLEDGCRDMAQWLAGRFGISCWTTRRWVHAAHALEDLPLMAVALEDGRLSLDKVLELSRCATSATERSLIAWARRVSVAAVRHKAEVALRRSIEEARDYDRCRSLRWCFNDGRMGLYGEFPAAQGRAIATAISRVAERLPELPADLAYEGYPDSSEERLEQRRADALWALAATTIAGDADVDRATVVVHTTLEGGVGGTGARGGEAGAHDGSDGAGMPGRSEALRWTPRSPIPRLPLPRSPIRVQTMPRRSRSLPPRPPKVTSWRGPGAGSRTGPWCIPRSVGGYRATRACRSCSRTPPETHWGSGGRVATSPHGSCASCATGTTAAPSRGAGRAPLCRRITSCTGNTGAPPI